MAIQNGLSKPFTIESLVKQGYASHIQFRPENNVDSTCRLNRKGGIDNNTSQLAAYADDIVINIHSKQNLINYEATHEVESGQFGLLLNASKAKVLTTSRTAAPTQDAVG